MTHTEILHTMRDWIAEQLKKAEQPGGEAFTCMSLAYCMSQAFDAANNDTKAQVAVMRQDVLAALQKTARHEYLGTYDVVQPYAAYFLIDRTLATT